MSKAQDEIQKLLKLLKTEKEEDLNQYLSFIKNSSLAERVKQGLAWYPVEIKETGYGIGDYPFVVLERPTQRDKPHQFNSGKAVSLFSAQPGNENDEAQGTIHFVQDNTMKIILYANDLPDWISDGKIGVNLLFDERSYREMESALKKVMEADRDRLAELREILLGDKEARFETLKYKVQLPELNESQNEAVNNILSAKDVAIVHGPPGTGKTTTLVQAIKLIAKEEKNILVSAPSNAAADLLTEKLAQQGLNVVRIGNISRIDESLLSHTLEGRLATHPQAKDIKRVKKQADEYRRMALKYKRKFDKADREQRTLLLKEAKSLAKDAVKMEDYLVADILSRADALTCTLVGSINRYIENYTFKTVVIDEAAQALEPANWIPITKAGRVILAGDPFQLPPTVKSVEAARGGLNITLMEKCIHRLPRVSLLKVQYRMNEHIMGFSNREFYGGQLQAAESVAGHGLDIPDTLPLEFIDTAGCSFDEKMNLESSSLFNPGEADILGKHLLGLIQQYGDRTLPSIGIISPYREQVRHLQAYLSGNPEWPEGFQPDIDTIDSFQGQERDVIYISLVRSNENGEIGFLSDYRRMNVAMTRARKKLIIIGDSATLGGHKFYSDFLDYVDEMDAHYTAWVWM
jgi:superfamily I DNA and/or RNA helicase